MICLLLRGGQSHWVLLALRDFHAGRYFDVDNFESSFRLRSHWGVSINLIVEVGSIVDDFASSFRL